MKFAAQSERFNAEQRSLLEDEIDADLAAVAKEIEQLGAPATPPQDKQQPKRQALPANLPRREIRHEPETTTCGCGCQMKRIGEDVYASGKPMLTAVGGHDRRSDGDSGLPAVRQQFPDAVVLLGW